MPWMQFSQGFRLDPIAEEPPKALVVLLHEFGASAAMPVAGRWAASVSTTAFIALEGLEPVGVSSFELQHTRADLDGRTDVATLDCVAQRLQPLLEQQLRSSRLDASQLVLVGFGYGGTAALHLLLRQGWSCAGVLAFAATLTRPLPRGLRVDYKIRLIDCAQEGRTHNILRDVVASLTARGIDARGVLLAGSALSDEAIRHGGSYLVELVATAQRGNRFHVDWENSHV
jgi:predicted esterase